MGGKKKYIEMFGSFTEPFNCNNITSEQKWQKPHDTKMGLSPAVLALCH